ncbi:hypothetical protein DPEC_G00001850 [Dallia pectoralis]|uniref:Uncharacterized protein n=1 Tax=Dallia pectoralis TaxID=75939 RepID=A0ACC2HJA2_DALPE|nr:hypothetical protein DPEC_G00001850 [Dallia pectoralis]
MRPPKEFDLADTLPFEPLHESSPIPMNTEDIGPSTSGCSGTTRTYYSNYTDLYAPIVIDDDDDDDEDEVLTVKETNEASSKEPICQGK